MPPNETETSRTTEDVTYSVTMLIVVTLGLSGNLAIIFILRHPEHRRKPITYLMLNIAMAHTFICIFGYPIAISYHLRHRAIPWKSLTCDWLAFANALVGIASIMTFTYMSVTQYQKVTQLFLLSHSSTQTNKKRRLISIAGIWGTAFLLSFPPTLGWGTFEPMFSGASCHPNWASQNLVDKTYALFLVIGGFFIPLAVITYSYTKTYRFMKSIVTKQQRDRQKRRTLARHKKLSQIIFAATLAFLISWTPYCVVSLVSTIIGNFFISHSVSLIPQLMAKSSVITSPLVYLTLINSFRSTLVRIISKLLNHKRIAHRKLKDGNEDGSKLKGESKEFVDLQPIISIKQDTNS